MTYQIFTFLIRQLVVRVGGRLLVDIKDELNFCVQSRQIFLLVNSRGHFFGEFLWKFLVNFRGHFFNSNEKSETIISQTRT